MKKLTAVTLVLLLLAGCGAPAGESPAPTETPDPTSAVGLTPAPEPDWEGVLAHLQPEDIQSISLAFDNGTISPETLAPLVREAMGHPVERPAADIGEDTVWSISFTLTRDGREGAVTLFAGLEENLVGLFLPGKTLWLEDGDLYQMVRTSMDRPPDIDGEAYEKYGDFIRAHYDGRMAQRNEQAEDDIGPGWTTSGWELVELSLRAEWEDLGIQVYEMRTANFVDPPELAPHRIAGGAYVDSQLRIHGWDWKRTYLAVVDGEPTAVFYRSGEPTWSQYTTRQEFLDMVAESGNPGG